MFEFIKFKYSSPPILKKLICETKPISSLNGFRIIFFDSFDPIGGFDSNTQVFI